MPPRSRRVVSAGLAAGVAVLVLMCMSLVHHESASAAGAQPVSAHLMAEPAVGGHVPSAPHDTSHDECALPSLVACARTSTGSVTPISLLLMSALALAGLWLGVARVPVLARSSRWRSALAPPLLVSAPSLSVLCISRT